MKSRLFSALRDAYSKSFSVFRETINYFEAWFLR
jgi:hypothetical protein